MGFLGSVVKGVTKVADFATGGKIGGIIADGLEKLGLPKEICNACAMIGDPSYSTKAICEEIDRVGKALGLPEELTGALKKIAKKAEQYTQAFFQGGFGAVVCALGKDLGLPPALYEGVAAAIDAYTGNEAGAAAHLAKFAMECAKFLGVPAGAMHGLQLAADIAGGNTKEAVGDGLQLAADVADGLDIAPEFKDLVHAGADIYASTLEGGDKKALAADLATLGGHLGDRLGLPPEFSGGLKLGAACLMDNKDGMKAAGKELSRQIIGRLDVAPEVKLVLNLAVDKTVDNAGEVKEFLGSVPSMIKDAGPKLKQQVAAVSAFIEGLAADKTGGAAAGDIDWNALAGNLLEAVKTGSTKILAMAKQEAIKALAAEQAGASAEERLAIGFTLAALERDADRLKDSLRQTIRG
jgi:hypothetical protein